MLEGSALIIEPNGARRRLSAGSTAFFARGARAEWTVERYIRKVAFCHAPMSKQLRLVQRTFGFANKLWRGARAKKPASALSLG